MGHARRRHAPEQIIRKLREAERLLGEDEEVAVVAKQLEVSEQTLHRWRLQYGGLKADDAKRLKELERENARLKRIVADQTAGEPGAQGDREGKLLSPPRRRDAVRMIVERFGLSERRACEITGQHRSTQRHRPRRGGGRDDALRSRLRKLSAEHPRWGYRLAWGRVRDEGWAVNRKKIQRLWREEGLRVPPRKRKRLRLGESTVPAKRLRAERPNHVWALDFQFDTTTDGRTLKLLHVVDEHTREALAIRVARSIDADHTVRVLDRIVGERGTGPELSRMDNGPEMTANAVRDWCCFGGAGRSFIEPGSPWQNPFVESFGSRVRDELLSMEAFDSVLEAQTVINDWKNIYNHKRPHSSLGWKPPAAYAASLSKKTPARLS